MADSDYRSPILLSVTLLLLFVTVLFFSPLNRNQYLSLNLSSPSHSSSTAHDDHQQTTDNDTALHVVSAPAPAPSLPLTSLPEALSSLSVKAENKSKTQRIEEELARARAIIRKAILTKNYTSDRKEIYIPRGSIYRNPYAFHQLSLFSSSIFSGSISELSTVLLQSIHYQRHVLIYRAELGNWILNCINFTNAIYVFRSSKFSLWFL